MVEGQAGVVMERYVGVMVDRHAGVVVERQAGVMVQGQAGRVSRLDTVLTLPSVFPTWCCAGWPPGRQHHLRSGGRPSTAQPREQRAPQSLPSTCPERTRSHYLQFTSHVLCLRTTRDPPLESLSVLC